MERKRFLKIQVRLSEAGSDEEEEESVGRRLLLDVH